MVSITSAQNFVKLPQFVAEATEGTFPTASPSFTSCGSVTSLEFHKINEAVDVGQVGTEDLLDIAAGEFKYQITMTAQLQNSTFLKRFTNAANYATPAGTISESVSLLWSEYLNGVTENFIKARGVRPKSVTLELGRPGPITARYELLAMDIAKPTSTHGLTTPTFASNPAGAVWTHTDGGANPVGWNAIGLNAKSITITVERNTNTEAILGSNTPLGSLPHQRQISGNFVNVHTAAEATTLETDYDANTSRTLAWVLKSATSTATVTLAEIVDYSRVDAADDTTAEYETVAFRGVTLNVT